MPLLNSAALYIGTTPAKKAYVGGVEVWSASSGVPTLTATYNDLVDPAASDTPNTTIPGTPAADDLLFDVISWAGVDRGPPTYPDEAMTLRCQADSTEPDNLPDTAWFAAKTCDGTEVGGSTNTKTLGSNTDWSNGMLLVHGDTPYHIVIAQARGQYYGTNSSITLLGPEDVEVADGDLVLWLAAVSASGSESATIASVTQPDGFTEIGTGVSDVWEETLRFFYKIETAGTYTYDGTATFTANNSKVSHVGVFVLRQGDAPPVDMGLSGTLPNGTVGDAYDHGLTLTGDYVTPVSWDISTGTAPSGTSIDSGTGHIAGTLSTAQTAAFTVRATDSTSPTPQVATSPQSVVVSSGGGSSFATFDPTRKGTHAALSGGNLVATITDQAIVCATNPIDIKSAALYWEIEDTTLGDYIGMGLAISTVTNFEDYLGDGSGTLSWWSDGSFNDALGTTIAGDPPACSQGDKRKFALIGDGTHAKLYIGIVGVGWWNASLGTYTANPALGLGPWASGVAGTMSPAVSAFDADTNVATANFGSSSFADTPPSGTAGWPAS